MGKTLLACLFLGAALYLFVYSLMATASDGQGILIFMFTLPPMLGFILGAIWLAQAKARGVYRTAQGFLLLVVAFFVCAFIPGLNLFTSALIGGVAGGYKILYGETPYAAHHHTVDVVALVEKSLEGEGGKTLDLRGFHLPRDWRRLCLFGPHTTDDAAVKVGLPTDWPLSTYSKVQLAEGYTALVLVGEKYPVTVVDLPRGRMDFADNAVGRCYDRSQAVFTRGKDGKLAP